MKIIVISPRFPYPLEKGDKLRLYYHIKHLSFEHQIVLISLYDNVLKNEDIEHIREFVSELYLFKLNKFTIVRNLFKAIFSKLPFQVHYFFDKGIKKNIENIIKKENPDIVYNQLIRTAEYTKNLNYFKVIDYMDSFSEGMRKRINTSFFPFSLLYKEEHKRLKKYESDIFAYFQKHLIISEQDKNIFEKRIREKLIILPNGVNTQYFSPMKVNKKYDIGFVGNMGYRPNILATVYLANYILPELKKDNKNIKVLIAGARPKWRVRKLQDKNIHVSGWIEDIRVAYSEIKVFVSPIFTGIGQQNKILEAMAMEIPVITTSTVNNAIGAEDGKNILVADNKDEFYYSISKILHDPILEQSIGDEARQFILEKYNWEIQKENILKIFKIN